MTQRYIVAALITAGFIIYGSLAPFHFHPGSGNAVGRLLAHWRTPGQSAVGFVGNVALYLPLGLFVALALAPRADARRQALWAGVMSLALCVSMELTQFYDANRKTTLTDVYLNVAGGLLGALIAIRMPRRIARPVGDLRQPVVWVLLGAFAVIELYPFVPTLNMGGYTDALSKLWQDPDLAPLMLGRGIGHWLLANALIAHLIGPRRSRFVLPAVMAVVFTGQIVIPDTGLSLAEWVGAAIAAGLWWALAARPQRWRLGVPAATLAALLIAERFTAGPGAWLPFSDLADDAWIATSRHGIAHFYPIGGLIWLAGLFGLDERLGGLALGGLLLAASALAAITASAALSTTDTALALLAGVIFWALPERAISGSA